MFMLSGCRGSSGSSLKTNPGDRLLRDDRDEPGVVGPGPGGEPLELRQGQHCGPGIESSWEGSIRSFY